MYDFLKQVQGIDKPLTWLAHKFGILELPPPKPKKIVPGIEILNAHKRLFENKERLDELNRFGISDTVIKEFSIGYVGSRYWIPIKDESGDFINVKIYKPDGDKKNKWAQYYGKESAKNNLYPIENLLSDTVYIFEGEKDCLTALSLRPDGQIKPVINAITNTVGAGNWDKNWGRKFRGKNVVICMDIDDSGRRAVKLRADNILPHAAQVKVIVLPLDEKEHPKGDFADWVALRRLDGLNGEQIANEFLELVESATPLESADGEIRVTLAEASKHDKINKCCQVPNVIFCGKSNIPYGAPKKFKAICTGQTSPKRCSGCTLLDGDFEHTFEKDNPIILQLIGVTKALLLGVLRRALGINGKCADNKFDIESHWSIESVTLIPRMLYQVDDDESDHVVRNGFYVHQGEFIKTNKTYNIKERTTLDSKTQAITHQIYEASDSESNTDSFQLTPDSIKKLSKFRVAEGQTVIEKMGEIHTDLSKLAGIYQREDLFAVLDMSYHSVISFTSGSMHVEKGWVEACVIGDTAVGKSQASKFISRHYRLGEFIGGESTSYAGLVGGVTQSSSGSNWTLRWGTLPMNDKRLVIIDEAGGIKEDDMDALSQIRSSGIASIHKVVSERTKSRTRIVWLANPKKRRSGCIDYMYPITILKELFPKSEDQRRVDIALIMAKHEVSNEVISKSPEPFISKYDSDSCHDLVRFAWSRKSNDIVIDMEVARYITKKSNYLTKKYSPSLPLIESGDTPKKLARLAVATAVRVFNTDSQGKVIVGVEHVDYAVWLLDKIYESDTSAYLAYSVAMDAEENLRDPESVANWLGLNDTEQVRYLLMHDTISNQDLKDLLGANPTPQIGIDNIAIRKRKLFTHNAFGRRRDFLVVMQGLKKLLRNLKQAHSQGKTTTEYFDEQRLKLDNEETLE
jgi:hypothetical protein